jgi:hypothetical protein
MSSGKKREEDYSLERTHRPKAIELSVTCLENLPQVFQNGFSIYFFLLLVLIGNVN